MVRHGILIPAFAGSNPACPVTYGEFEVAVVKKNSKMYSFVNYSHIFSYVAKENENIAG